MRARVGAICAAAAAVAVAWAAAPQPERAWSTQLHLHGSFSEGPGSIDSHVFEAARLGVDVLWWSDHDYRITASRSLSAFGFEGAHRPYGPEEPWPVVTAKERAYKIRLMPSAERVIAGATAIHLEPACEGEKSLRLRGASDTEEFAEHVVELQVSRDMHTRSIAGDLVLRLSVLPERASADATGLIEVALSEHPDAQGEIRGHGLRFVLTNDETEPRREGSTLVLPLPFTAGEWNHYELPITRQVAEGFPELVAGDDSLHRLGFGIRSRRGSLASVFFDDLQIEQSLAPDEAYGMQRRLMAAVAERRPSVRQHQGVEVSYMGPHLNEISVEPELIDLDELYAGAPDLDDAALEELYRRRAIEGAHARGGLVSLNHFFGAGRARHRAAESGAEALARLVDEELYGADLLEVGYRDRGGRDLREHLWVWDRLPHHGQFPVGIGVSDSHGGPTSRWDTGVNNFVTWIWSPSTERADLIEGLRAGRCFLGDIVLFRGTLDLSTAGGRRMGAIVVTGPEGEQVEVRATGLEEGERVHIVVDGERAHTWPASGPELTRSFAVARGGAATVVRAEVTDAADRTEAVSNPITLVESPPPGVDPARLR